MKKITIIINEVVKYMLQEIIIIIIKHIKIYVKRNRKNNLKNLFKYEYHKTRSKII